MDSILSFWNLEQLSQAIPQFLALPAYHTLLHPASCPSPGSLWDQQGMGRRTSLFVPPPDPSGIDGVWDIRR